MSLLGKMVEIAGEARLRGIPDGYPPSGEVTAIDPYGIRVTFRVPNEPSRDAWFRRDEVVLPSEGDPK